METDKMIKEYKCKKLKTEYARDTSMLVLAWISFAVGIALTFWGFATPPVGEISGSALGGIGQFLSFTGAVLGIGEYGKIQIKKMKYYNPLEEKKEEGDKYDSDD